MWDAQAFLVIVAAFRRRPPPADIDMVTAGHGVADQNAFEEYRCRHRNIIVVPAPIPRVVADQDIAIDKRFGRVIPQHATQHMAQRAAEARRRIGGLRQ